MLKIKIIWFYCVFFYVLQGGAVLFSFFLPLQGGFLKCTTTSSNAKDKNISSQLPCLSTFIYEESKAQSVHDWNSCIHICNSVYIKSCELDMLNFFTLLQFLQAD